MTKRRQYGTKGISVSISLPALFVAEHYAEAMGLNLSQAVETLILIAGRKIEHPEIQRWANEPNPERKTKMEQRSEYRASLRNR